MIAILGGGISGLSVAYGLKKAGKEFMLLESNSEVGGKIKSEQRNGFTLEMGPNTVLINNAEVKGLLNELDLEQELIFANSQAVKNRQVLVNGKIVSLPSGPKDLFGNKLLSFRSLFKILNEPFVGTRIEFEDEEESLASFVRRRLGNEIYENFIYPFVTGIYAGDPEQMSMDYTLKVLKEAEQRHGSILKGMLKILKEKKRKNAALKLPKQKIFTFQSGLQRLTDRMHESMNDEIICEARIDRVIRTQRGYMLVYWKDDEIVKKEVSQVISCLPAFRLASVVNWNAEFSEALKAVHYVPALVSHFALKTKLKRKPSFGILTREKETAPFLGVLFNSHFFPHTAPAGYELITVISGGHKQSDYEFKADSEIQEQLKAYLKPLLDWKEELELETIFRWEKGIPQYNLGHHHIIEKINDFESKNPGFYLLGNFREGISVSDCIQKGLIFAQNVN